MHRTGSWLERLNYIYEDVAINERNNDVDTAFSVIVDELEEYNSHSENPDEMVNIPACETPCRNREILDILSKTFLQLHAKGANIINFFEGNNFAGSSISNLLLWSAVNRDDYPAHRLESYQKYEFDCLMSEHKMHMKSYSSVGFDLIYYLMTKTTSAIIIRLVPDLKDRTKKHNWSYHALTVAGIDLDKDQRALWVSDPADTPTGYGVGHDYLEGSELPVGQSYYTPLKLEDNGRTVKTGIYKGAKIEFICTWDIDAPYAVFFYGQ